MKASLESRGMSVVTTSGALVSLVAAMAALLPPSASQQLPAASLAFITAALVLFVAAAAGGLFVNTPATYEEADLASLRRLTEETYWSGPKLIAGRRTAELQVDVIAGLRRANATKAHVLMAALAVEVGAIGLMSAGVIAAVAATALR